jgi:hypothetical protein
MNHAGLITDDGAVGRPRRLHLHAHSRMCRLACVVLLAITTMACTSHALLTTSTLPSHQLSYERTKDVQLYLSQGFTMRAIKQVRDDRNVEGASLKRAEVFRQEFVVFDKQLPVAAIVATAEYVDVDAGNSLKLRFQSRGRDGTYTLSRINDQSVQGRIEYRGFEYDIERTDIQLRYSFGNSITVKKHVERAKGRKVP